MNISGKIASASARIDVLDHGYVELIEVWGSDERIIESARMSTGKGFLGWGTEQQPGDEKLLSYLWKNKHTSVFEQCGLTFEVQAPIVIFREWHRHRTKSYNEFSARYAQMPDLHYLPTLERIKKQSTTNKQATGNDEVPIGIKEEFLKRIEAEQKAIYKTYEWALEKGIAKEIARINTPVSRYSKMRVSANLLNWLRFLSLRLPDNAMWEIRQYAQAVLFFLEENFPKTAYLFKEYRL